MVYGKRLAGIILAAGFTFFLTMGPVTGVAAQSDTRLYALMTSSILGWSSENVIEIVDLDTLTTIRSIPVVAGAVESLAVSPDENRLYVTFNFTPPRNDPRPWRSGVAIYDVQSGNEITTILLPLAKDSVISADGSTLYVTAGDEGIIAIDTTTDTISRSLSTSPDYPISIALSPDGRTLALAMSPASLYLVDADTLTLLNQVPVTNLGEPAYCGTSPNDVVFTDTGVVLLWDSNCDNLYQVDVASANQDTAKTIYSGRDTGSLFNYNNMLLYSSTTAQSFVLKESEELAVMDPAGVSFRFFDGFGATPFVPALSPDGEKLYIALFDGTLDRFDVLTRQLAHGIFTFSNAPFKVRDAHILPMTTQAATGICLSGKVPVVVFSSGDIDADDIRIESMDFGGAAPLNCRMRDVNRDGDKDLVCKFRSSDIASGGAEAVLRAETYDGRQLRGSDILNVIDRNCVRRNQHDDDSKD